MFEIQISWLFPPFSSNQVSSSSYCFVDHGVARDFAHLIIFSHHNEHAPLNFRRRLLRNSAAAVFIRRTRPLKFPPPPFTQFRRCRLPPSRRLPLSAAAAVVFRRRLLHSSAASAAASAAAFYSHPCSSCKETHVLNFFFSKNIYEMNHVDLILFIVLSWHKLSKLLWI